MKWYFLRWFSVRSRSAFRNEACTEKVCYVDVPVEVALYRNRNRAATGGRWTPEHVILDKARVLLRTAGRVLW